MTDTNEKELGTNESQVQANLAIMRKYFDLLFSKELDSLLEIIDDNIEWLIVPTAT